MDYSDIYDDLYEALRLSGADVLYDRRAEADTAWSKAEYAEHNAVRSGVYDTDACDDYDDIEFAVWEETYDLEPEWTESEIAHDMIECDMYDAELLSDAAQAWSDAKANNRK